MVFASENTRQWVKAVFMSVLLGAANMAMAAGGLNNVESNLKDWFQSFYGILGILAMFALAGTAAWGYLGKKHWSDILEVCGWIFFTAASAAIVKAVWDWGKSATF